jgi:hypothetical protein
MVNVRSRIGVGIVLMLALSSLLLFWSALTASAQTVDGCQGEIDALITATESATFSGKNAGKDEAGLIGKLESASTKLGEGKNADAVQSLTDFRTKVSMLNEQGKIDPEDAAALIREADEAIACIQSPEAPQ